MEATRRPLPSRRFHPVQSVCVTAEESTRCPTRYEGRHPSPTGDRRYPIPCYGFGLFPRSTDSLSATRLPCASYWRRSVTVLPAAPVVPVVPAPETWTRSLPASS